MKGLSDLLRALQSTRVDIDLLVYGVIRDQGYWEECVELASKLPPNARCRYVGEYQPSEAKTIMSQADLFVLPTHGENFGHAIAEALSVGCPVVISPHTIWTTTAAIAGYVTSEETQIRAAIEDYCGLSPDARFLKRVRTLEAYRDWFFDNQANESLFSKALAPDLDSTKQQ